MALGAGDRADEGILHGNAEARAFEQTPACVAQMTALLALGAHIVGYRGFGDAAVGAAASTEDGLVRDVRAAWEWATRARDGACAGRVLLCHGAATLSPRRSRRKCNS